jgi:hypothetical protein
VIEKLVREFRLWKRFEELVMSLTEDMFAFQVNVGGLTYDVYHARRRDRGTPLSVALRIRQEDGRAEVTAIEDGCLSAREMAPKIADAQAKELR